MAINWGRYQEAYKAIHDAILSGLTAVPEGKKITKQAFTYANGTVETIRFYDGAELLFTLTFTWNADGTLKEIERS